MNFIKLLETLSDRDLLETKGSRRDSFDKIKHVGKDIALASIPFAMAATSKTTRAANNNMAFTAMMADNTEVLKFALTLEYLEREFYQKGLDSGVIEANDKNVFAQISKHEDAHVDFLLGALELEDGDMKPEFDFTAGGALDPFNDYPTFMGLSQGFEDTGVRAYKGQAGALANDGTLLTYALQIHSVEARHASQVRRMRDKKGWITKAENDLKTVNPAFDAIYNGVPDKGEGSPHSEANTTQGGVNLSDALNFDDDAISEAFDEILTMGEVNAIASLFIK